ncbi:MAG TPA: Glu-tRNA(Gln) amidotransferase subunit GatD [Candidatus Nanoarchaeia archaeon]|nr:Glu-tRNA(Gln) amidotransferase subunit GatD [Candidatus Nanoarchaeia archaeon]
MKEGDMVRILTKDRQFEGVLMPSVHTESVVLKLSSGYNVGILKSSVKKTVQLGKRISSLTKPKKHIHVSVKKTVSILHTGGTIASKVDYETGAVGAHFSPDDLIEMFPELEALVNLNSRFLSNMWSEDMRFSHYNTMAKEIKKEVDKGVDGVIITHGTDTMHFTAAALSFILEDLSIPVILVGAQRSSDRGSSDAAMNLVCAIEFMTQTDFAEVAICMHKGMSDDMCWILPGLKCRKLHSSRRNAFQPVNAQPYAEIDYLTRKVHIVTPHFRKKDPNKKLILQLFKDVRVGLVKTHPHMFADVFTTYTGYDGLVIEGSGLGHVPINKIDSDTSEHQKIFAQLQNLAKKMPVVMASQTLFGRVNMNVYSTGRVLQEMGVLGNFSDMMPETTYIKLAWLLSNYPKKVKEMIGQNLRGELSERSLI